MSSVVGSACRSKISTMSSVRSLRTTNDDGALVSDVVSGGSAESARLASRRRDHALRRSRHRFGAHAEPHGRIREPQRVDEGTVRRDGRSRDITVKLGEAQNEVVASNCAERRRERAGQRGCSASRCAG